jgi:hypothetical protein
MRNSCAVLSLAVAAVLSGCTHTMSIRNADEYVHTSSSERPLTLVVETDVTALDAEGLVEAVKDGLAASPSVHRVWSAKELPPGVEPDYVVVVRPVTDYEGSGWNYPITFPGFLVFTHAWNGYHYKANVTTELALRDPGVEEALSSQTVETHWNLRHCDFERGALNSSGWYTPFYGALNIFIGFWMLRYDSDATPDFVREAKQPYGNFIAAKVIEMAAKAPTPTLEPASAEPAEPSAPIKMESSTAPADGATGAPAEPSVAVEADSAPTTDAQP